MWAKKIYVIIPISWFKGNTKNNWKSQQINHILEVIALLCPCLTNLWGVHFNSKIINLFPCSSTSHSLCLFQLESTWLSICFATHAWASQTHPKPRWQIPHHACVEKNQFHLCDRCSPLFYLFISCNLKQFLSLVLIASLNFWSSTFVSILRSKLQKIKLDKTSLK